MDPLTKTDLRRGAPARPPKAPITTDAEQACLLAEADPSTEPDEQIAQRPDAGNAPQHGN